MSELDESDSPVSGLEESLDGLLTEDGAALRDSADTPDTAERNRAILAVYLDEISRVKLLTPEEEQALARSARAGDTRAEARLVEANLRLVVHLARRYRHRGLPLLDQIEEGNLGLLHAARKFEPDRGTRFSTYATWWIRQALTRALANQARTIRLPVHVEQLLSQYLRTREILVQELGRPPTIEEVAARLGQPVAQLEHLEAVRQKPLSLDSPVGPEGTTTLEETVQDESGNPADRLAAILRDRADLLGVLQDLPDNERRVIALRFGLEGSEPMTLEGIGKRLGVTRERVRQIEGAALRRLRGLLAARGVEPSDLH
ncbi:MAG: sigma-70 family RNA polymerase sigma factor [Candidatus Rokubacteria bacterium]|nr:sigma-70 family RNA polymerase sigma factor [Candidatus Rokubacteria bacterium]